MGKKKKNIKTKGTLITRKNNSFKLKMPRTTRNNEIKTGCSFIEINSENLIGIHRRN